MQKKILAGLIISGALQGISNPLIFAASDNLSDNNISVIQERAGEIKPDVNYEGSVELKNKKYDYYSTKHYPNKSAIGLYFTVPVSGTYSMIDSTTNNAFQDRWSGVQKQLYQIVTSEDGIQQFVLIAEKEHKLEYGSVNFNLYTGDPLVAYLEEGEQYLLLYNNDRHEIPGITSMTIRTQFERQ